MRVCTGSRLMFAFWTLHRFHACIWFLCLPPVVRRNAEISIIMWSIIQPSGNLDEGGKYREDQKVILTTEWLEGVLRLEGVRWRLLRNVCAAVVVEHGNFRLESVVLVNKHRERHCHWWRQAVSFFSIFKGGSPRKPEKRVGWQISANPVKRERTNLRLNHWVKTDSFPQLGWKRQRSRLVGFELHNFGSSDWTASAHGRL